MAQRPLLFSTSDLLSCTPSPDFSLPPLIDSEFGHLLGFGLSFFPKGVSGILLRMVQPTISSDKFDSAEEQHSAIRQLEKPDQIAFNDLFYMASIYIFFVFFPYANDLFQQRVHLWYPKSLLTHLKPPTMGFQRKISLIRVPIASHQRMRPLLFIVRMFSANIWTQSSRNSV